ncbi:MAG: ATP-binding protein [Bacteroidota bacterium]
MELHEIEERQYKEHISKELYDIFSLRMNKDRSCIDLCDKVLEQAKISNNQLLMVELFNEKTSISYHFFSDYKKALQLALQTLHLCIEDQAFSLAKINCLSNIAIIYSFLGELTLSRNNYTEAIRLLESIPHPNHYIKKLLGNNYFNLTNLYKDTSYNDTRIGYLNKAKDYFLEINYKLGYARCLNSYSIYHPDYKNTELGLNTYIEAEQLFRELNDSRGRGVVLSNMGLYYSNHGQFEKGIECLNTSVELLEALGQKKFMINAYQIRGIAYSNNNYFEEAIQDFKKCKQLIEESESKTDLLALYQEWSYVLQKMGNYEESLYMLHKYILVKNEIEQFDKKSALSEEKIAFELLEKEKEANFLRKKNEEIQAYLHQLELTNKDLQRFAHIASHDLREPLRMVNLFVQKLEKSMAETANTDQIAYFNYIKLGARRMYSLIDSVLNLNNIHPVVKKEAVDINAIIEEIQIQLYAANKEKQIDIKYDDLPILMADKNLLFQVFQNLLSNSIKYNKSEIILINISARTNEEFHEIRVADNGIGINEDYREKVFEIFHRLNAKNEYEGTGIGLTIVKKIIDTLKGKVSIDQNFPSGTVFILQFPV